MPALVNSENRWSALLRVTRAWRLEWQADQLLARVAREAVEFLGLERGVIWLAGQKGLSEAARWPLDGEPGRADRLAYSLEVAQAVLHSGRAVFAHEMPGALGGPAAQASDMYLIYCVPLTATRGILGALYLDARETARGLTPQDQEFLEMLGLQAAAALEHALLYQSAITDPLTGLFSHRHFQQEVEQAVRRANRTAQPLALLIFDLDRFKALNDSRGHEEGNRCLIWVAAMLQETLRSSDILARFGGDEFEVLLPSTAAADAWKVAEKVRRRLEEGCAAQGFPVTTTVGVSGYPDNAPDGQTLFLRADEALYRAKEEGRNRTLCSEVRAPARPAPDAQRAPAGTASNGTSPDTHTLPGLPWPGLSGIRPVTGDLAQVVLAPAEQQVDGHRVVRRLGAGASGEVLLVRQPELDREVALKRPLTPHLTEEQAAAFELEAKVTASLNHPGVITVLTMGKDLDGRRYYTMKPLRGQSLAEILLGRREEIAHFLRTYTEGRLLEILLRASETLAYAHQQGVAHLDLTPSNIVVGEFGEVTLVDWGSGASNSGGGRRVPSSQAARPAPEPGPAAGGARRPWLAGSPVYLAPEHLPGGVGSPGPGTDVHALGSILYEVLVGVPPFSRASTRETLEAILKEDYLPPERARPEAGIDPSLSELCRKALQRDPALRLTAAEFADRLGRFVRREQDWEVIRFGTEGHPCTQDEWHTHNGKWALEAGAWSALGTGDATLIWKVPVPGAFRFIAEAWSDHGEELAILGCGAGPDIKEARCYQGYFFEFGAEKGSVTKLARHEHDILVRPNLLPEPGRRYRLEMAYEDGWLHCFLDEKRIFTYRELFPFLGRHVGFYSYGTGAHFRPLELHRQNWGLQVPAMRMADDLFRHGSYEAALERYRQLSELYRHRLEGDEARLKVAICHARLQRSAAAVQAFHALEGSLLEPFAKAEEALLHLQYGSAQEDPERAVELFRELLEKFPESHAKASSLEASMQAGSPYSFLNRRPLDQDLAWRAALHRLGRETLVPPANSQLKCWMRETQTLLRRGQYAEALDGILELHRTVSPIRPLPKELYATTCHVALVCGREDVHSDHPAPMEQLSPAVLFHVLVRKGVQAAFLKDLEEEGTWDRPDRSPEDRFSLLHLTFQVLLSLTDRDRAEKCFRKILGFPTSFEVLQTLRSARQEPWWGEYLKQGEDVWLKEASSNYRLRLIRSCRACGLLEGGRLEEAARELQGWAPGKTDTAEEGMGLLLQILLHSLGLLREPARAELEKNCALLLAGAHLDLARMFLGQKAPEPGERWPHPLWEPERRLWLALWLEARGKRDQARAIAEPACDERYGLTHSQPALRALLARLDGANPKKKVKSKK